MQALIFRPSFFKSKTGIKWKGESSGVEKRKWLHIKLRDFKPRGDISYGGECIKIKIV